ncbi:3-mercaptopyruvate sulfurtransferase [Thalassoporum mexicanum PCC 7367]|uniref:sulfurtransferase n=1 Tax=Thalassoporum mexicanum TaxID=3457544 RepID=UPI00029F881D|nr:sulfurtransferase [Pseudanabaena sp. PCC 7367]AFY71041.1 3-mercaptopyruvate sulfurtransferase [Pseudanabaena sp. PCC 7367]
MSTEFELNNQEQSIALDSPIVSIDWLQKHLNSDRLVIIDCRFALADPGLGRQKYQAGHIPGAYYLDLNQDLSSPVQKHGGRHPLPELDKLAAKLGSFGINSGSVDEVESQESIVVLYDDSRFAFAARAWWLLRYLGHHQVAILDGGFSAWHEADQPISARVPPLKVGNFAIKLNPNLAIDIDYVQAKKDLPSVALIDSRAAPRYRGEVEPIDPIAGHIPGAVNYPWQEVSDACGNLQKLEALKQRWAELKTKEEVLVYCGSGVTACVNLWSMAIAGLDHGKLYVGSWSDWCSYADTAKAQSTRSTR